MNGSGYQIIDLTPENIAEYGVCGYKDAKKHLELQRKIEWFNDYYPKGLRIKALILEDGGYQGMLEYIPGEYAHRPVAAAGYLFIHCLFVGFRKEYKGHGYASALIGACIDDARVAGSKGVAVVARDGSFMAKRDIFLKQGFRVVDRFKPDFELLALAFDDGSPAPCFSVSEPDQTPRGLTVMRSPQCPYSVKNVDAIIATAEAMGMPVKRVELDSASSVQHAPCAFGAFCIVYDGQVVSHHPISNTRFVNIMKRVR